MASSLAERLEGDDRRATVTAFPDGSVDRFYAVLAGDERIDRREAFAERLGGGRAAAVTLRPESVEAGGHATNVAGQADLLGNDVALLGHLDHPAFALLPFETVSMGDPARVAVHEFDDGDFLTVEPSLDVASWSVDALAEAVDRASGAPLSADVLVCTNWTTFDAIPDALAHLATEASVGSHVVVDPGGISDRSDGEVRRLFDALAALDDGREVVLAANGDEMRSLADAVATDAPDDHGAAAERVRTAADVTAAVVHEPEAAVAATTDGHIRAENFEVEPVRRTGGGDRFDAGLAHALARGWDWADALTLGNACASRYVATAESATADALAAFLRQRE